MKVRISGNSIRFRLKQSEVEHFKQQGNISEVTEFGMEAEDTLTFSLVRSETKSVLINKVTHHIKIEVPSTLAAEWTNTSKVGFEENVHIGGRKMIRVLVEKDFKCLDGSDIDNEDSFPNPNTHC